MQNLLFAEIGFSNWILPAILLVIVVASLVMGVLRKGKYTQETQNLMSKLTVGVKVKTFAGVYGEIVEIRDALDGSKVALIKTGENGKESFMSIDLESVYAIDKKDNAELFAEELGLKTEKASDAIKEEK